VSYKAKITDWLKSCIEGLESAEPNKPNGNIEMTVELRDVIVENLKKLDEYNKQLQKAHVVNAAEMMER